MTERNGTIDINEIKAKRRGRPPGKKALTQSMQPATRTKPIAIGFKNKDMMTNLRVENNFLRATLVTLLGRPFEA